MTHSVLYHNSDGIFETVTNRETIDSRWISQDRKLIKININFSTLWEVIDDMYAYLIFSAALSVERFLP